MDTHRWPIWLSPIAAAVAAAVILGHDLPSLAPGAAEAAVIITGCETSSSGCGEGCCPEGTGGGGGAGSEGCCTGP